MLNTAQIVNLKDGKNIKQQSNSPKSTLPVVLVINLDCFGVSGLVLEILAVEISSSTGKRKNMYF